MSQESPSVSREIGPQNPPPAGTDYHVIDVGRYARLFWRRRLFIVLSAILGLALAAIIAYTTHPLYDADVRLMPPDRSETLVGSLSLSRNTGDLYLGLISSRTVADDVIAHQHLAEYFHTTGPTKLRASLAAMAQIAVDKDQFVTVTVRAREPADAMRIANEFPAALYRLNQAVALSKANHRWEYYEVPLEEQSHKLADAEDRLKEAQQKTGLVMPEAQVQLGLSAIASLKSQITLLDEQLAAARTGRTDQDPDVIRLKTEIGSLSGQLSRLEAQNGGSGRVAPSAELPGLTLEIDRKIRDVKLQETLFEILSHQYENAKVDASYSPPIELVDHAVLPDQKAYPRRRLWMEVGLVLGGLLGIVIVILQAVQPVRRLRELLREPELPGTSPRH